MSSEPLDPRALELAALYAMRALDDADEREVVERYENSSAFWAEVRSLERSAGELFAAAPERPAPEGLFERVRERLASGVIERSSSQHEAQVWKSWAVGAAGDETIVRGAEPFEPTPIPGIVARRLFADRAADRVTMMVRMDPGTSYPAHRHGGAEECYVLEGELCVGDGATLRAGDYQRMEAGSIHPVQSTVVGCTLLLTSSFHDEMLERGDA